ncbi:calcium channel, voltage-dependent, gamma subunit 1a [Tachysurus ichikawai]
MQKSTKVKITFVIILVGIVCMFTAVVSDHWAVLSHQVERVNSTCEAAHFGLWRLCKKNIYIEDPEAVGTGCGPLSLPGG